MGRASEEMTHQVEVNQSSYVIEAYGKQSDIVIKCEEVYVYAYLSELVTL